MIELYQAERCRHSSRVRQRFTEPGASFLARPAPADPADREEMRRKAGSDEIPTLVLGDAIAGDADALIAHLDRAFASAWTRTELAPRRAQAAADAPDRRRHACPPVTVASRRRRERRRARVRVG